MDKPKQYAERNPMELDKAGGHYARHVLAMTAEGLHSKADIAMELGHRDMLISQATALLIRFYNNKDDADLSIDVFDFLVSQMLADITVEEVK